ncbi:MAG: hypothetical protein ACREEM_18505 [Blastocatellia bacterium]
MSEEMNKPQENSSQQSWEAQLQQRANELLARRIGPFKAELERLQASFTEISAKLLEQARPETTEEESASLLDHVRRWFSDLSAKAEEDFKSRIEEARTEAATAARESEARIEELREQLEASRKALTLAVSSAQTSNFDSLRAAIEAVDVQRTQSATLTALISSAAQFAPRVVFFVLKGGNAVGWKARGFENGLNDETAKLLSVRPQTPSLLADALNHFRTTIATSTSPGDNSAVLGLYGSPAPERAVAVPLVVRGKAAAVLYADSGTQSENSINTAAIETLMRAASMGIELLPARREAEAGRPPISVASVPSSMASLTPAIVPGAAPAMVSERPTENRSRDVAGRRTVTELRQWATSLEEYEKLADSYATENDQLRAERTNLRSQVEQLEAQVAKLEGDRQALLAHLRAAKDLSAESDASSTDDIAPGVEGDDAADGAPTSGEVRFYKKEYSGPTHDVMVRVQDCGCNNWQSAHSADKARKGIAKLENDRSDWKMMQHCASCTGGGMWKVRW